jgi:hypothetical protein
MKKLLLAGLLIAAAFAADAGNYTCQIDHSAIYAIGATRIDGATGTLAQHAQAWSVITRRSPLDFYVNRSISVTETELYQRCAEDRSQRLPSGSLHK